MSKLIEASIGLLSHMFSENRGLFSFSTRIQDGRFVSDFSPAGSYRYTLTVLAGLERLGNQPHPWNTEDLLRTYLGNHLLHDNNLGNRGLLLHLLSSRDMVAAEKTFHDLAGSLAQPRTVRALPLQEIAWISLGLTTFASRSGGAPALKLARTAVSLLDRDLMTPGTLLPRHDRSLRGGFVSFGGVVYFLMALHHFASTFNDEARMSLFLKATSRVIDLQGPGGEWPWFLDAETGRVMDWYQVYSVHQDSMAMLFLLPAHDLGHPRAEQAIRKSYRWLFGDNQLQSPMLMTTPFFIYRSIRRAAGAERMRRLAGAIFRKGFGREAVLAPPNILEINRECRSYHPGWILYAWAGRHDFEEFTGLRLQNSAHALSESRA